MYKGIVIMKGKHTVIVQNNKLHYEFEIKRNITIIQGDSATGKTTLIDMIRQFSVLGASSGIDITCDVPVRILEGPDWKLILQNIKGNILFIDEGNSFINTVEFASLVRSSDNYFVLITRENLYNLPYSVEEIYGLHSSGKYQNTKRVYQHLYQIYPNKLPVPIKPQKLIIEDSNSGYEFFKEISERSGLECISANGKSNIFSLIQKPEDSDICVIADGAAIGPEMSRLYNQIKQYPNIKLYLPESFEWIILNSGLISNSNLQAILEKPENYIDSTEYFSWERYFTQLLISITEDTYLKYRKSKLNKIYLHEKNAKVILDSIDGINF